MFSPNLHSPPPTFRNSTRRPATRATASPSSFRAACTVPSREEGAADDKLTSSSSLGIEGDSFVDCDDCQSTRRDAGEERGTKGGRDRRSSVSTLAMKEMGPEAGEAEQEGAKGEQGGERRSGEREAERGMLEGEGGGMGNQGEGDEEIVH
eukprot:751923-Hanusia_phi.AAC.2